MLSRPRRGIIVYGNVQLRTFRTAVEFDRWLDRDDAGDFVWSGCGDNADSMLSLSSVECRAHVGSRRNVPRHTIPKLLVRVANRILEGENQFN
jgi:hypothetical protein